MDVDGAVRAMVGGFDDSESQFNRAIDALRAPGSSFKPYVYATALMNGFKPTSIVVDLPVCIGNWCPKNYSGGFSGSTTLTNALGPRSTSFGRGCRSRSARATRDRPCHDQDTARKAGLRTPLPDTPSMPIAQTK